LINLVPFFLSRVVWGYSNCELEAFSLRKEWERESLRTPQSGRHDWK
jgi:hypothetical protein